jgi:hypothetical protein
VLDTDGCVLDTDGDVLDTHCHGEAGAGPAGGEEALDGGAQPGGSARS